MKRVVCAGGTVAAYAWDMLGGGFPYHALQTAIRERGTSIPEAPSTDASRLDVMQTLWEAAGLQAIETRTITLSRTFNDFDDFWTTALGAPSVGPTLANMTAAQQTEIQTRLRSLLPADDAGRIHYSARANAIKGNKPL